jgi:hypothetical protein
MLLIRSKPDDFGRVVSQFGQTCWLTSALARLRIGPLTDVSCDSAHIVSLCSYFAGTSKFARYARIVGALHN